MSALALTMASGASAATIIEGGPLVGSQVELDPSDFVGAGRCGYGGSVVDDGCSVVLKSDPDAPDAYGRFDPNGATWIDSQDLSEVTWTVTRETAFTSLTIALTDAYDQPDDDDLGPSYFNLASADALPWSAGDTRRLSGVLDWLTITYDAPVTTAEVVFTTRLNDGWGIVAAVVDGTPAPVPLPASGALLVVGLAGLAAAKRRKG